MIPKWALYAAVWFGGRAMLLSSDTGTDIGTAVSYAIGNPLALPAELRALYAADVVAKTTAALSGAFAMPNPLDAGGCVGRGIFC